MNVEAYRCASAQPLYVTVTNVIFVLLDTSYIPPQPLATQDSDTRKQKQGRQKKKSPGERLLWTIYEHLTFHGMRLKTAPRIKANGERLSPYAPNGADGIKVKVRSLWSICQILGGLCQ